MVRLYKIFHVVGGPLYLYFIAATRDNLSMIAIYVNGFVPAGDVGIAIRRIDMRDVRGLVHGITATFRIVPGTLGSEELFFRKIFVNFLRLRFYVYGDLCFEARRILRFEDGSAVAGNNYHLFEPWRDVSFLE